MHLLSVIFKILIITIIHLTANGLSPVAGIIMRVPEYKIWVRKMISKLKVSHDRPSLTLGVAGRLRTRIS